VENGGNGCPADVACRHTYEYRSRGVSTRSIDIRLPATRLPVLYCTVHWHSTRSERDRRRVTSGNLRVLSVESKYCRASSRTLYCNNLGLSNNVFCKTVS
jgi:hypothetical protein